jgi:uncharacterized protein YuzE
MFVQANKKINYDNDHDILYIFIGPPKIAYEDEVYPGIFLRKDDDTDEVIGAVITGYKKLDVNDLLKSIPFQIDFEDINQDFIQ